MPAAKSRRAHTLPDNSRQTTIPIVQMVATIRLDDPNGTHSPLEAAYLAAAAYIQDTADGHRNIRLEWQYGDGEFVAEYLAPPQPEPADLDRMD